MLLYIVLSMKEVCLVMLKTSSHITHPHLGGQILLASHLSKGEPGHKDSTQCGSRAGSRAWTPRLLLLQCGSFAGAWEGSVWHGGGAQGKKPGERELENEGTQGMRVDVVASMPLALSCYTEAWLCSFQPQNHVSNRIVHKTRDKNLVETELLK